MLEAVAEANAFLEGRGLGRIVVVGGCAVGLYTGSAYRTGDVDVIIEGAAGLFKKALGLIEEWRGRAWMYRGLRYAIVIVPTSYDRPKPPVTLEVGGRRVYVEPPGESIVSCLNACVYRSSDVDCEKAAMVMAAQWPAIDWQYLEERCRGEGVYEKLEEIGEVVVGREEVGQPARTPTSAGHAASY